MLLECAKSSEDTLAKRPALGEVFEGDLNDDLVDDEELNGDSETEW
jgi:hypothetical protein